MFTNTLWGGNKKHPDLLCEDNGTFITISKRTECLQVDLCEDLFFLKIEYEYKKFTKLY